VLSGAFSAGGFRNFVQKLHTPMLQPFCGWHPRTAQSRFGSIKMVLMSHPNTYLYTVHNGGRFRFLITKRPQ